MKLQNEEYLGKNKENQVYNSGRMAINEKVKII